MVRTRVLRKNQSINKTATTIKDEMYTYENLPEERKKSLQSMIEDFDKQVEDRIEDANTEMHSLCKSIRNSYKVAVYQLTRHQRDGNHEELVLKNLEDLEKGIASSRESEIFSTKLAKVAERVEENVASTVQSKVMSAKKSHKKKGSTKYSVEKIGKYGPLTSTATSNRRCEKIPEGIANLSNIVPASAVTPRFTNASINRQMMRLAKPNEIGISLNGSPIIVADNITPSKEKMFDTIKANFAETLSAATDERNTTDEPSLDEDMEALVKFQSLRNQMGSMAKMNDENTIN